MAKYTSTQDIDVIDLVEVLRDNGKVKLIMSGGKPMGVKGFKLEGQKVFLSLGNGETKVLSIKGTTTAQVMRKQRETSKAQEAKNKALAAILNTAKA